MSHGTIHNDSTMLSILLLLLLIVACAAVQAVEYVIITDSSIISPDEAVAQLAASPPYVDSDDSLIIGGAAGGALRKKKNKSKLKVNRKVHVANKQTFGLIDDLDSEDESILKNLAGVQLVVPNVEIFATEITAQWNLDRLDQSFGLDGKFLPTSEQGKDIDLYILDSGVKKDHVAFTGRVLQGMSAVDDDDDATEDCVGHGTHVASTAAGVGYGVATKATIIPVKFINCDGKGDLMSMAMGANWILQQMKTRKRRTIINASIESAGNAGVDALVQNMYNAGAVVVVAAGNQNKDACGYSPARVPNAVTVGSSTNKDSKVYSSNVGDCIDLFAPGGEIVGAGIASKTAEATKTGTSMASPLVAGVVATLWERFPKYTNAQVVQVLLGNLVTEVKLDCQPKPVKFIQSMSALNAAARGSLTADFSTVALGAKLQSDFLNWSPQLVLDNTQVAAAERGASKSEVCVSFAARVAKSLTLNSAPESASFRMAISTQPLLGGLYSSTCTAAQWFVIENSVRFVRLSSESNSQLVHVPHVDAPVPQLSDQYAQQFYLVLRRTSGKSVEVEFGKGDGKDERSRDPSLSAQLDNYDVDLNALNFLSFSAPSNFDIEYSNIQNCNTDEMQTKPDTGAGGGAVEVPSQLTVSEAQRREFFLWPSAWAKPELSLFNCVQFSLDDFANLYGRISVSMSANALGVVPVSNTVEVDDEEIAGKQANKTAAVLEKDVFEIQLSKTNTVLLYNDNIVDTAKNENKINNRNIHQIRFQVSQDGSSIAVDMQVKNSQWKPVYSYQQPAADNVAKTRRFALASFQSRTFRNVQVC